MLGSLLALLSAMSFAFNDVAVRRGILYNSVYKSIAVTVPIGVPLFIAAMLVFDCYEALNSLTIRSISFFGIAGIIHFIFGRYCNYKSIEYLGTTLAGPVMQISLLISVFFAFFILNEIFTYLHFLGIILILLGPMIILAGSSNNVTKSGIKIDYTRGFMWGILCSFSYGTSPLLIKLGSNNGGIKDNIVGGFVSYFSASMLLFIIFLIVKIPLKEIYKMEPSGRKWFLITGFMAFISQLLRYMALALLAMSIVEPIQRSSAAFRVLFGYLINKEHEIINSRVLAGILISLMGVYVLISQLGSFVMP